MQVTKEAIEPCQIALTIEVEPDQVIKAYDRAYREYGKYVNVPGFRKGKAPLSFVKQRVPESEVRQRTAEILVEPAYAQALTQEEVEPFAQPKLELLQLEMTEKPFIFKAIVPVKPEVELGAYTGLSATKSNYELTDTTLDEQIQRMRERAADFPIVERAAQTGDLMVTDLSALVDMKPEAAEVHPTMIEIGADNIPGFDDNLIGMSAGETKTFTLTYPEDYPEEELAGEEAEFTVTIKEVREKQVPELDDALASTLSNGKYPTLEELRREMRTDMEKSLADRSESETDSNLIDQILASSTIKYPPVLVEAEVDDDVRGLMGRLEQQGATLDEYLESIGKTREQLVTELAGAARRRIEIGLLLGRVSETENLILEDADLDAALTEQAETQRTSPAAIRAVLESNGGMEALRNRTQAKKVLDFLRGSAIIEEKVVSTDSLTDEEDEDVIEDAADDAADTIEEADSEGAVETTEGNPA